MSTIKTINGLAIASAKTRNGLARASIKTINGMDVPAGGTPFGGAVDTTSLVDWWPLASAGVTGVHAGLDLTNSGASAAAASGPDGSDATLFNLADPDYMYRTSEAALQAGDIDFTLTAWFKCNSLTGNHHIVAKRTETAGAIDYRLVAQVGGAMFFQVAKPTDSTVTATLASSTITTGTWYLVVAWHDATANTANIEINANTTIGSTATGGSLQSPTSALFTIGRMYHSSAPQYFDGYIQRVGFWKRVLTSGERTALYNSGNGLDY